MSGALLTELSKTVDCIFSIIILCKCYKANYQAEYKEQKTMMLGIPQVFKLGQLLFNIHICGTFYDILTIAILRVMLMIIPLKQVAAI